ncbi:LacI family DNA-binding transcriptional regulator [Lactonifactor longoviformis]|uniref:Transcriptional regulator, LacI family n=1 Tax=Lactonifactor longoviformis DSM 17459 TaxID=1122155 RepID=A0A1M4ZX20_9CLOT|nr:LacI family DNA-binding transcriptional regulator [Lactonifactor longoviformis]SHF22571.1 transcriptional regulator, LacI family [Lactonifactor longoviformis DSM 17459]
MVTLKDVANTLGLSVSTISRVLNEPGFGSEKTRVKVLKAIEELGYTPNTVAQSMIRGKTNQIALVIPDVCNPFYTSIARGVEDVCLKNKYRLLLCNTDENTAKQNGYLDSIRGHLCDGFVISVVSEEDTSLNKINYNDIPFVMISRKCSSVEADFVGIDDHYGAYRATTHLIRRGHRKIATICGKQDTYPGRMRLKGYLDALKDQGIEENESYIINCDFTVESAHRAAHELLRLETPPTAIFVANNLMTLGCLTYLKEHNIKVPEEISVVAFYEPDWASICYSPLTCVDVSAYEMGTIAAELLFERLEDASFPKKEILLTPELTVRESCGGPVPRG